MSETQFNFAAAQLLSDAAYDKGSPGEAVKTPTWDNINDDLKSSIQNTSSECNLQVVVGDDGEAYIKGDDGFAAVIFRNGDDVVISYRGSDFGETDDFATDYCLATGGGVPSQFKCAEELYNLVNDQFSGSTISFTGHSLGGGISSQPWLPGWHAYAAT